MKFMVHKVGGLLWKFLATIINLTTHIQKMKIRFLKSASIFVVFVIWLKNYEINICYQKRSNRFTQNELSEGKNGGYHIHRSWAKGAFDVPQPPERWPCSAGFISIRLPLKNGSARKASV